MFYLLIVIFIVAIDYKGFRPSGDAYITLTRTDYLRDNLRKLENFTLLGLPVKATPKVLEADRPPRSRGEKGRTEAVARGAHTGDGLKGNFPNTERNVVIWGLPGRLDPSHIEEALRDFKLGRTPKGRHTILKVPLYVMPFVSWRQGFLISQLMKDQRTNFRCIHASWLQWHLSQKPIAWCGVYISNTGITRENIKSTHEFSFDDSDFVV